MNSTIILGSDVNTEIASIVVFDAQVKTSIAEFLNEAIHLREILGKDDAIIHVVNKDKSIAKIETRVDDTLLEAEVVDEGGAEMLIPKLSRTDVALERFRDLVDLVGARNRVARRKFQVDRTRQVALYEGGIEIESIVLVLRS